MQAEGRYREGKEEAAPSGGEGGGGCNRFLKSKSFETPQCTIGQMAIKASVVGALACFPSV